MLWTKYYINSMYTFFGNNRHMETGHMSQLNFILQVRRHSVLSVSSFHSFMVSSNMFLQMTGCSGSVITLVTGISYSWMLTLNMDLQATYSSVVVFTMLTGISYTFMLAFNMFLQMICCSGSIYTLHSDNIGIFYSFMFTFNMDF